MKTKYISTNDAMFESSDTDIEGKKENERFSGVLEILKRYDIIKSYKEFADNINETSVGLNDIKKGRKKLSVNHIKNINIKYPFVNTDFILFEEGMPFYEDFLTHYSVEGQKYKSFYKLDLEAIMNCKLNDVKEEVQEHKDLLVKYKEKDLTKELLSTKDELLEAKDKIMKLQAEIYELKLKLSR